MFWTYIIQNPAGQFYVGQTDDLLVRVKNHNRTDKIVGKFTRKNGPWILVWSQEHPDRSECNTARARNQIVEVRRLIRERLLDKPSVVESRCNRDYTRKNGPWRLLWSEEHPDRASAMRRERQSRTGNRRARCRSDAVHGDEGETRSRCRQNGLPSRRDARRTFKDSSPTGGWGLQG